MALSKITADSIAANAVNANSIGYTPANKAGDTFTGDVAVSGSGLRSRITDGTNYLTMGQWDAATNRIESSGGRDMLIVAYGATQQLRLQHATTGDALRINANSHVTKPYQPSFYAYHSTSPTPTNGSLFVFDSTNYNSGMYSTSTGRMTAPVAGRYFVSAAFRVNNQNAGYYAQTLLFVNGASTWQGSYHNSTMSSGSAGYMTVVYTGILSLGQGDYVQPYWTVQGGTTVFSGTESWFSGHLLG
jgi:hypothetical protein